MKCLFIGSAGESPDVQSLCAQLQEDSSVSLTPFRRHGPLNLIIRVCHETNSSSPFTHLHSHLHTKIYIASSNTLTYQFTLFHIRAVTFDLLSLIPATQPPSSPSLFNVCLHIYTLQGERLQPRQVKFVVILNLDKV